MQEVVTSQSSARFARDFLRDKKFANVNGAIVETAGDIAAEDGYTRSTTLISVGNFEIISLLVLKYPL